MIEITREQLLGHLKSYGSAVHCGMYVNYNLWYYENATNAKFFYDRGCAIVVEEYEHEGKWYIHRQIHQISPDADIDAVTAEWQAEVAEHAQKFVNPDICVMSFIVSNGDLPPEKDKFNGKRNFSRKGEKYFADNRVRELTPADSEIIKSACTPSLEKDTEFGKQLAKYFVNYDFEFKKGKQNIFGIFDGESLVGMATRSYEEPLDLVWLIDIFVGPDHRKMGLGSALILTVLSDYPDKKWHYQVAKQNTESLRLVKSLGFTLEGAGLIFNGRGI